MASTVCWEQLTENGASTIGQTGEEAVKVDVVVKGSARTACAA